MHSPVPCASIVLTACGNAPSTPSSTVQRFGACHRSNRVLEYGLSRPCTRHLAPPWQGDSGRFAGSLGAARPAAHQPYRRPPLGRRHHVRTRRVQLVARYIHQPDCGRSVNRSRFTPPTVLSCPASPHPARRSNPWSTMPRRVGRTTSMYSPLLSCSVPPIVRKRIRKRPSTHTSVPVRGRVEARLTRRA